MANETSNSTSTAPVDAPQEADSIEESAESLESPESVEAELAPEGKAAPKASVKEIKKEEKRLLKKLRLKVDGKEFDEEFDPNDDEYMTRQLQLAKASGKRSQEYSTLQKEVATFIEELRKNPRKVLADPNIGIDIKQLAAQVIEDEINNSKKSPEQLQREQLEEQLRQMQEERKTEKDKYQKEEFERIQQQEYERYDMLMSQTLEKSDLPKTPYIIKKMADYMLLGLQQGLDISPDDVLPLVREEMQKDLKEMFQVMPDDVIENMVGKDVLNRLRKKNVANAKAKPPQPLAKSLQDTGKTSKDQKPKDGPKRSYKDFFGV
jgi:hypothetical protein